MKDQARIARIVFALLALAGLSMTLGHAPAPASASAPGALVLADHALASASALADESPYELIDPIGPGAATRDQAIGEVTASTMIGGIYRDSGRDGGGYGQGYLLPTDPIQPGPQGYGGYRAPRSYGGYQR